MSKHHASSERHNLDSRIIGISVGLFFLKLPFLLCAFQACKKAAATESHSPDGKARMHVLDRLAANICCSGTQHSEIGL